MSTPFRRTALQVNAVVALLCVALAAAIISLVLTQPQAVAAAVAQREFGAIALAVARHVAGWLQALLRFV